MGLRDNDNSKRMADNLDWWTINNSRNFIAQVTSNTYCKQLVLEYTKTSV